MKNSKTNNYTGVKLTFPKQATGMTILSAMRLIILMLLPVCVLAETHVYFNLTEFNANPSTNRQVDVQPLTPFRGNVTTYNTGTSNYFFLSNAIAADYAVTIKQYGQAQAIQFQVTVTSTGLGVIGANTNTSVLGVQTYPTSGKAAWSILASDSRYVGLQGSVGVAASNSYGLTFAVDRRYTNTTPYYAQISSSITFTQSSSDMASFFFIIDTNVDGTADFKRTNFFHVNTGTTWSKTTFSETIPPGAAYGITNLSVGSSTFALDALSGSVIYFATNSASVGGAGSSIAAGTNIVTVTNGSLVTVHGEANVTQAGLAAGDYPIKESALTGFLRFSSTNTAFLDGASTATNAITVVSNLSSYSSFVLPSKVSNGTDIGGTYYRKAYGVYTNGAIGAVFYNGLEVNELGGDLNITNAAHATLASDVLSYTYATFVGLWLNTSTEILDKDGNQFSPSSIFPSSVTQLSQPSYASFNGRHVGEGSGLTGVATSTSVDFAVSNALYSVTNNYFRGYGEPRNMNSGGGLLNTRYKLAQKLPISVCFYGDNSLMWGNGSDTFQNSFFQGLNSILPRDGCRIAGGAYVYSIGNGTYDGGGQGDPVSWSGYWKLANTQGMTNVYDGTFGGSTKGATHVGVQFWQSNNFGTINVITQAGAGAKGILRTLQGNNSSTFFPIYTNIWLGATVTNLKCELVSSGTNVVGNHIGQWNTNVYGGWSFDYMLNGNAEIDSQMNSVNQSNSMRSLVSQFDLFVVADINGSNNVFTGMTSFMNMVTNNNFRTDIVLVSSNPDTNSAPNTAATRALRQCAFNLATIYDKLAVFDTYSYLWPDSAQNLYGVINSASDVHLAPYASAMLGNEFVRWTGFNYAGQAPLGYTNRVQ